jgi:hypothetical protein
MNRGVLKQSARMIASTRGTLFSTLRLCGLHLALTGKPSLVTKPSN